MNKLTDKQQAFIDEYLIDLNATQAAIRAGYSEETAKQIGSENLSKLDIQKAIQVAQQARREANKVTRESIAREIDDLIAVAKQNATEGNTQSLNAWVKAIESKAKLFGLYDLPPDNPELDKGKPEAIIVRLVDASNPNRDPITGEQINTS